MADEVVAENPRYASRKFLISVLIVLLSTLLVWFGKIDAKAFQALVAFVAGAYMLGNVGQKGLEWWLGAPK